MQYFIKWKLCESCFSTHYYNFLLLVFIVVITYAGIPFFRFNEVAFLIKTLELCCFAVFYFNHCVCVILRKLSSLMVSAAQAVYIRVQFIHILYIPHFQCVLCVSK